MQRQVASIGRSMSVRRLSMVAAGEPASGRTTCPTRLTAALPGPFGLKRAVLDARSLELDNPFHKKKLRTRYAGGAGDATDFLWDQ
jgi:hypothetical protein